MRAAAKSFPLPRPRPEEPPASTANSDAETGATPYPYRTDPLIARLRTLLSCLGRARLYRHVQLALTTKPGQVGSEAFVSSYQDAMDTARVKRYMRSRFRWCKEDDQAEFGVRVTWDTAVTGQITRDYSVPLTIKGGRWGIRWHGDAA